MRKQVLFSFLILLLGFSACKQEKQRSLDNLTLSSFSNLVRSPYRVNTDSIRQIISTRYLMKRDTTAWDSTITRHYQENGDFLWLSNDGFEKADSLVYWLENSGLHGLDPEFFSTSEIRDGLVRLRTLQLGQGESVNQLLARLEYRLTRAYLYYSCGLNYGFIRPSQILNNLEEDDDPHAKAAALLDGKKKMKALYTIPLKKCNKEFASKAIENFRQYGSAAFRSVQPSSRFYLEMQKELQRLNALGDEEFEKIPSIGGDTVLKVGDSHRVVPFIARRLMRTGEFIPVKGDTVFHTLTPELLAAVNKFRDNNRLVQDNSIGSYTIRYLNRPLSYYKDHIKVNLERARWQYRQEKGKKYILVNTAAFMLQAFNEKTDSVLEMKICCGSAKNKTPLLSSSIYFMELNPYWNVPQTIIRKEMIPAYRRDTAYFTKNRLKVYDKEGVRLNPHDIKWSKYTKGVPFSVKQDNKQGNSLGRIIFRFPNAFAVYLHDTPSRYAFMRTNRAVSHGCVRLEKALDFAFFLLQEPDEKLQDRIRLSMDIPPVSAEGKKWARQENYQELKQYTLKERVPLYIDYQTMYLSADGTLRYCDDVYNFDALLLRAIKNWNHK